MKITTIAAKLREFIKKFGTRLHDPRFVIELLALTGLAFYVCETKRTNDLTQQALEDERTHFNQSQRPWVGMAEDVTLLQNSESGGIFKFVVGYKLRNFGSFPALNTVVALNSPIGDANNYGLVKTRVNDSCKLAESLVPQTGDLLLPGGEKPDTWTYTDKKAWPTKFVIPGCIVYRNPGGAVHHTQLCYWINFQETPKSTRFGTCWFQSAD
jgi:hypothetical protein